MKIDETIQELESTKNNIRFTRLLHICNTFFGKARMTGSHHIFKTLWEGDPRINLQEVKGKAKPYQVQQVLQALRKLKTLQGDENNGEN